MRVKAVRSGADAARGRAGQALSGLLFATGAAHFAIPHFYDMLIPRALPGTPRAWVLASGGAELACAAALANRRTRRVGALLSALLFVAIFPANVKMAVDWAHRGRLRAAIGIARLPLQVPLIYWALTARRQALAGRPEAESGRGQSRAGEERT